MNEYAQDKLKKAAEDLRYLLNRKFPKERSLNLIGDRYNLKREQRDILHRAIFSEQDAKTRRNKLIPIEKIKGKSLGIDGHNILITTEVATKEKPLIVSDDGLIRDIAGVSSKYVITNCSHTALKLILNVLLKYRPKETLIFFDAPISKSGQLAKIVRDKLKRLGLKGDARAVKVPETELINYEVIATSDSAVIDKAKEVVDLAGYIIKKELRYPLIKL